MKKSLFFVLFIFIFFIFHVSSDNVKNSDKDFIYNGIVADWITYGDDYIYSRIEENTLMTNIITGVSYELVRDPFFEESNETQRIKYIFSDDIFVYYLLSDANSRYEIIRQNHETLEKKSIFKKEIYKEQREILFGVTNTIQPNRRDYLNDNIPNRFAVFENCLFIFENTRILKVNLTTKKENTILDQSIYNGNYSYYNGILYFISDSYDIYAYHIQTEILEKVHSYKAQLILVTPKEIYFSSANDRGNLYQMDFDFINIGKCVDSTITAFDFDNDYLYYIQEGDSSIYRRRFNDNNIEKVYVLDGVFDLVCLRENQTMLLLYVDFNGNFSLKSVKLQ